MKFGFCGRGSGCLGEAIESSPMRFRPPFRRRPRPSRRVAEAETAVEEGPAGALVEEEALEPPPPPPRGPLVWPWLLVLLLLVIGGLVALWLLTRDDDKKNSNA